MRAPIKRDDARIVDHLVEDDHGVWGLEELHVVVVCTREHRWSGIESEDAPFR